MARRSDIRRIGAIMRHGGADGSLVAWVEAELERVDFADPVPGCLATLVDDLTGHERQLIVAALATVALEGPAVRSEGLDASVRIGRELGIDVPGVERILRDVSGWSMKQARELARRKLPATTSPAALAEARRHTAKPDPSVPMPHRETLRDDELPQHAAPAHGGPGPASLPLLDEVHFELPELTEAGAEPTHAGRGVDVTDPSGSWPQLPDPTASARHTERMDDLAEVIRRLEQDPDPNEPDDEGEPLGEDPPTVEMTPDAVRALLHRKAQERAAMVTPPRFSSLSSALGDEPVASDGPPTLGLDDDHNQLLSVDFDTTLDPVPVSAPPPETRPDPGPAPLRPVPLEQGLQDLPPLDWGEGDAFTVSDFTLSERVAEERFDAAADPSAEEPTQFVQVPPEVQRLIDEANGAHPIPSTPTAPEPAPAPNPTMDLDLDDDADVAEEPEDLDLDEPRGTPLAPSLDDVALDADFLEPPPSDKWVGHDPHSTAELLELDIEDAPASAFDRALSSTGPLPVRPDSSQDLHTGEGLRAAPLEDVHELSLDSDERELSLDPDTGDRIAVASNRAVHWAPPDEPAVGLPIPSDDDVLTPELQPLQEGLAAYWAPQALHQSDGLTGELRPADDEQGGLTGELRILDPGDVQGGLTGELKVIDPGDVQGGLTGELKVIDPGDVQGGLTGELKVIDPGDVQGGLTGELRAVDPNDVRDGLTSELRPVDERSPRRRTPRRRRRGTEGITQDLTLLVDGDPTRRKGED